MCLRTSRYRFKEARKTSWKNMRQRVAEETGQDLNDVVRYYPPGKPSKNSQNTNPKN